MAEKGSGQGGRKPATDKEMGIEVVSPDKAEPAGKMLADAIKEVDRERGANGQGKRKS
jgi:hypothetical protein